MAINQFFAPSNFVMTTDESVKDLIVTGGNNVATGSTNVELSLSQRILLIANHQIYADWIYVWCIAYLANAHGAIKITSKDSLKWMPIFGWGMQFLQFIFLRRNWASDREVLDQTLTDLANSKDPLWLLIFPEGTIFTETTRRISKNYAEKNNLVEPRHVLLPRSTGLHFCMEKLAKSVDYVYDLTIGLEGIKPTEYPEDIYTLRRIYFEGRYPRNIHMHVKRFRVADIPTDENKFAEWLRVRWQEKDALMAEFYSNGQFITGVAGKPQVIKSRMNSVFELTHIWYFAIPLVPILWYIANTLELATKFKGGK